MNIMGLLSPFFRAAIVVVFHTGGGLALVNWKNPFSVTIHALGFKNPIATNHPQFHTSTDSDSSVQVKRIPTALFCSLNSNNTEETFGGRTFSDDDKDFLLERLSGRLDFLESVVLEQREEIRTLLGRVDELEEALIAERETLPQLLKEAGVYEYTDEEWEELVEEKTCSDEELAEYSQRQQPQIAKEDHRNRDEVENVSVEADTPPPRPLLMPAATEVSQWLFEDPASKEYLTIQVPSNIMEAADQAGSSVLEALVQGHRRLVVEVIDDALRDVAHMAEFIDLMLLPLAGTLQNSHQLEQRRCSIIFPSMTKLHEAKKAMSLEDPEIFTFNTLNNAKMDDRDFLTMVVDPWSEDGNSLSAAAQNLLQDPHHRSVLIVTHRPLPETQMLSDFGCAYYIKPMKLQFLKDSAGSPQILSEREAEAKSQHYTGTAIVQRQFPSEWVVIVNLGEGTGYQLAGAFGDMPSTQTVHQTLMEFLKNRRT